MMSKSIGTSSEMPEVPTSCQDCFNLDVAVVQGVGAVASCLLEKAYYGLTGQKNVPTTEWVELAMRRADERPNPDPQVVFGRRAQEANGACPITARIEQAVSEGNPIARVDIKPPPPLLPNYALQAALGFKSPPSA
jgi:hypothetical protein